MCLWGGLHERIRIDHFARKLIVQSEIHHLFCKFSMVSINLLAGCFIPQAVEVGYKFMWKHMQGSDCRRGSKVEGHWN